MNKSMRPSKVLFGFLFSLIPVSLLVAQGPGMQSDLIRLAEVGSSYQKMLLGKAYLEQSNSVEALKWFRKGAISKWEEKGPHYNSASGVFCASVCQLHIGTMYENGVAVKADIVQAYAWYSVAARYHNEAAKTQISKLWSTMSPNEKNEAANLANKIIEEVNRNYRSEYR